MTDLGSHFTPLVSFLTRYNDPETARDIAQDTLLKAWERRESLSEMSPIALRRWLTTVAKRVSIDQMRKSVRYPVTLAGDFSFDLEADAGKRPIGVGIDLLLEVSEEVEEDPECVFSDRALQETRLFLLHIPAPLRNAARSLLSGMSPREFHEVTGINHNTAKVQQYRCRLLLKERLTTMGLVAE